MAAPAPPEVVSASRAREPWFRRLPVKWKLVLIIMAITSACLVLVGVGVAVNDRFAVRREMVDRLSTMAQIVGANSTAALAFGDEKAAAETLAALAAERYILVAAIYDERGEIFARFDRDPYRPRDLPARPGADGHEFSGRELTVQRPTRLGDRRIGTVYLRAETSELYERLVRFLGAAGVLFLGSLALSFALSTRFQKVVTEPILDLVVLAREVSRTKDYGLRAAGGGSDELGLLVASFNAMLSEVAKRDSAQRFLAEAGVALSRSLDPAEIMREAARLPVGRLADGCAVEAIDPATGAVRRVSESGATANPDLECARVPLEVRDRRLGALVLCCVPPRRLSDEDRAIAVEVGRRTAVALENAQLYREAQEAVSARDAFLSMASHELKTPLTALLMEVQLSLRMARRGQQDALAPERMAAKLETLERLANQLRKLIGNLLDVSRIQAGRLDLERADMDLVALVREVVVRAESDLTRTGSTIAIEAPETLAGLWDRLRLDQVATNLIANAIKYGSGRPIAVRLERAGDRARLVVHDQGIGISPDDQKRIFERFERAVSMQHYAGFGLGLWIVRQIVEAHGGTIVVESTPGKGATFTVELPLG